MTQGSTTSLKTHEILREAANQIEGGFAKRTRHDEKGNCCAMGALENAAAGRRLDNGERCMVSLWAETTCPKAIEALARVVPKIAAAADVGEVYSIVAYNNAPERTKEEVAAKMRLAAHLVETGAFL